MKLQTAARWLTLIVLVLIAIGLFPTSEWTSEWMFGSGTEMNRWQFRYHALLADFTIDRWGPPVASIGLYLHIPDELCYGGVGGRTGQVLLQFHWFSDKIPTAAISIYGGDWWGNSGDYRWGAAGARLGNWCAGPVRQWGVAFGPRTTQ